LNVRCLFEGEEEIGSPSLPALLEREPRTFAADVAVVSDMPILGPDRPAITESLRGALSVELEVRGAQRDLHSGIYGGAVHNPLQALSEIIARLHEPSGRIAVPGFYDRVRSWSEAERAYMAAVGPTDADILHAAAASGRWGEAGYSLYERTTIRPALSVNGLGGGYQGPGVKAVIPAWAVAKLNLRLAPDQDPDEVEQLLRAQIERLTPPTVRSTLRTQLAARPATVERRHPHIRAAALAYRNGFGVTPGFVRLGGTIPGVDFLRRRLHLETVLMGFALPDDGMHAPNEKFHLPTFFRGIATSISFLAVLARAPRPVAA
jgi:acetylornithine deacetylase/succinyl-diaminopimelate desuccinylase-like protein